MNETEVCKAVVKSAFSSKLMPNNGFVENPDKNQLAIRNYLWHAAGFTSDDGPQRNKAQ